MMTTNEIRSNFLSFFKSKGHRIIASDSLVPKDDPTVLFTTAGMQQFKPQFLGRRDGFVRAATCQKCLRTDDLDCVGKTDFHHTFFEMLGNFSFGDYFKREAIHLAWEFLTGDLKLPKDKLWVSVYKEDDEAYQIWANEIKIPNARIVTLGDQSNFWPSQAKDKGPNGPCGPCSEIFFDYGVNPQCPQGKACDPDCPCGRFSEVWNLVFTQFNRKDNGILEPLPARNIDTGMGLERLAAVVQGKKSNYETDSFSTILGAIKDTMRANGARLTESECRIIADHMRAVTFGIADGVVPSNEGRGYVMRKLIVDIADLVIRAGVQNPVVHTFVDVVVECMKDPYPELVVKRQEIKETIRHVEENFLKTRKERIPELKKEVSHLFGLKLPPDQFVNRLGSLWFLYRDTYGLPLKTISISTTEVIILAPEHKEGTESILNQKMEEQKNRSRASSKMRGDVFVGQNFDLNVPKTEFLGYSETIADAKVLKIFSGQGDVAQANEGQAVRIVLNRTPFYAESGGQVGDTGYLTAPQAKVRVTDTQKSNDIFIHSGLVERGTVKIGDQVQALIDGERRLAIKRNHTATHLLQSALRQVLGAHIKQQGSLVEEARLRFDFTHSSAVKSQEIQNIENRIGQFILNEDKVTTDILSLEEAKKRGALAFFAEKYGQTVRVVSIGDYSKEFCGGTHVRSTGDIEAIKITSEGSVAQGIRRVEAVTGKETVGAFLKQRQREEEARQEGLRLRQLAKEKQNSNFELVKSSLEEIIRGAQNVKGISVITYCLKDADMGMLRKLSDLLKQKAKSAVMVLGAKNQTDAALIISITDDVVAKGVKADELITQIAPLFDAAGGGRPNMAQAGGKAVEKLDTALARAKEIVKAKL